MAKWDLDELNPQDLVDEYLRILKPTWNMFIFTSYNMIWKFHGAFDDKFDTFQFMVWHKQNPVPNFFKRWFLNSCELIVSCWNKGHKWNFKTQAEMHNFIESWICMWKERIKWVDWKTLHPTQKPVSMFKTYYRDSFWWMRYSFWSFYVSLKYMRSLQTIKQTVYLNWNG